MAAQPISFPSISSSYSPSSKQSCSSLKPSILVSGFLGNKLPIRSSKLGISVDPKRRSSTVATVSFCLPDLRRRVGKVNEKRPTWSARSLKSYVMSEFEAKRLNYPKTGTESLLLGILLEGTSLAAKFLRTNGITLSKVRDETLNLLGVSNSFYIAQQPPLTKQAKRALVWAFQEKLKSGESGEITATHMLLGIWSVKESAGHIILARLGFDDEKAKELARSVCIQEPFASSDQIGAHEHVPTGLLYYKLLYRQKRMESTSSISKEIPKNGDYLLLYEQVPDTGERTFLEIILSINS